MRSPTLDSARRLDIRALLRWFRRRPPGEVLFPTVRWSDGSSLLVTFGDRTITLDYSHGGADVHEHLDLEATACTFGGSRAWVRCPNCGRRRAVLYLTRASVGRFMCRTCHGLPYGSTRERAPDRALRRAQAIRARQGSVDPLAPLPRRPHQRLSTYERLSAEHDAAMVRFLDGKRASVERAMSRLPRPQR